ncbi:type II secretion system protein GspH [Chromatiales bacterium (ex Bugula neritina AB1)]|nr:type II secretion system protein GspH [Chromatiales bacterium (ex Bugula neritina AB1)]
MKCGSESATYDSADSPLLVVTPNVVRCHQQRGFSLLELIVVISMMAILTGVILPKLNIGGEKNQIRTETVRLAELMRRASEEAIFKTRELGIRFTDGDYQFLRLDGDGRTGKWVAYDEKVFRKREWPDNFEVTIEVAGVAVVLEDAGSFKIDEKTRPHVMFLSNGELMPDFRVILDKGILEDRWEVASGIEEPIVVGIAEIL